MGKITQTKILDDIIKKNIESQTIYSLDDSQSNILFEKDGLGIGEENGKTFFFKKNELVILPYVLNVYDEFESFMCEYETNKIHNIEGCYAITWPIDDDSMSPFEVLKKFFEKMGIEMSQEDYKKRIKSLEPIFISKKSTAKIYPYFVDISNISYDSESAKSMSYVNIDIYSISKYQIRDMNLLYMLSIIKDIS